MKYAGELYFEDNEVINVMSLIIRPDTIIAFSLVVSWNGGNWRISSTASLKGESYISEIQPSIHVETGEYGPDCKITFLKVEREDEYFCIEGTWNERGESYLFEGDLKLQT